MRSDSGTVGQRTFIEQARREQIVAAAIDALDEGGFGAASFAGIAARAGISKGVISYHFAGKAELMGDVVRRVLGLAAEYMEPRVAGQPSWAATLRRYLEVNLEFLGAHRREIRALTEALTHAQVWAGSSDPATDPYAEAGAAAVGALADLLTAGQLAGEFRDFDVRVMATTIRAAVDAASGLLRTDPSLDVTRYGAELVAVFERATAPAAGGGS